MMMIMITVITIIIINIIIVIIITTIIIIIIIITIIPGPTAHSVLGPDCQPIADFTFACLKIEVIDHPAS